MRKVGAAYQAEAAGWAVNLAAALTVVVAVALGVFAGNDGFHSGTVGAIAVGLALLRVLSVGRVRNVAAVLGAVVVIEPAVHAAARLFPAPSDNVGCVTASMLHIGFAAAIALAIASAQMVLEVVGALVRTAVTRVFLAPLRARPVAGVIAATHRKPKLARSAALAFTDPMRGPPHRGAAAAV